MCPSEASRMLERIHKISHEKFVIHGSTSKRKVLVPKRPDPTARNKDLHRKAVYATSVVEVAIMYAVIHGDPKWRYFKGGEFVLYFPEEGYKLREGYIHVCRKEEFEGNPLVLSSSRPVRPVEIIKVHPAMLEELGEKDRITFMDIC